MDKGTMINRLPPCSACDVEAMESWLYDMARKGFFLTEISCGIATFRRGEPAAIHYRLVSEHQDPTWRELLLTGDDRMGLGPDRDAQDLHARFGWEYVTKRGKFFVYRSEQTDRNPDTDPAIQAISINAVRKWSLSSLGFFLLYFLLFSNETIRGFLYGLPDLLVYDPVRTVGILVFVFGFTLCLAANTLRLTSLYRRLNTGKTLDHHIPWRKRAVSYFALRGITGLSGLVCFVTALLGNS